MYIILLVSRVSIFRNNEIREQTILTISGGNRHLVFRYVATKKKSTTQQLHFMTKTLLCKRFQN